MQPPTGTIAWHELTVENAAEMSRFYQSVIGWQVTAVDIGDYKDFTLNQHAEEKPVAGVCHQRGANSSLPSQWLMYVIVDDLQQSMAACERLGGQVIIRDRDLGHQGRMSLLQDPVGAFLAIVQLPPE